MAAEFGHFSIVKYLAENEAKIDDNPELIPVAAEGWLEPGYIKVLFSCMKIFEHFVCHKRGCCRFWSGRLFVIKLGVLRSVIHVT